MPAELGDYATDAYDYELPPERIAQQPVTPRDAARLLVVSRTGRHVADARVADLPDWLPEGALLVLNDTRVIPARLRARRATTGGAVEVLLLEPPRGEPGATLTAMLRTRGTLTQGETLDLLDPNCDDDRCVIAGTFIVGERSGSITTLIDTVGWLTLERLNELGEPPLPPYIKRSDGEGDELRAVDRERYQTVFAHTPGAVAAPTAGLHLTQPLLDRLRTGGIDIETVTLHVGLGTFAPIRCADLREHEIHRERVLLPWPLGDNPITRARAKRRPVIAVGTTSARVLESMARGELTPLDDGNSHDFGAAFETGIFVHPPQTVTGFDGLLTNFHVPRSTLMMFVAAVLAGPDGAANGRQALLDRYRGALASGYRFLSYGDAMLIQVASDRQKN